MMGLYNFNLPEVGKDNKTGINDLQKIRLIINFILSEAINPVRNHFKNT